MAKEGTSVESVQTQVRELFNSNVKKYGRDYATFMKDLAERMREKIKNFPALSDSKLKEARLNKAGVPVRFLCMVVSDMGAEVRIFSYAKKKQPRAIMKCALFGFDGDDAMQSGPYDFDSADSFSIEPESMAYRKCYKVTALPGMNEWFLRYTYGPDVSAEDFAEVAKTQFCAGFFDLDSHLFTSRTAFEVFGILKYPTEATPGDANSPCPQIDVISYAPIDEGFSRAVPVKQPTTKHLSNLVNYFKDFLGPKSAALHLISALCSSRDVTPKSSYVHTRSFPVNITDVKESKPIIESIKLLLPCVNVIKASDLINVELNGSDEEHSKSFLSPVNLAPGSILILDETDAPKGIVKNLRAKRNFIVLRNLVYRQELGCLPHCGNDISSDIAVVVLSRQRSHIIPTPLKISKGKSFVNGNNYIEHLESQKLNSELLQDMRKHLLHSRWLAPKIPLSDPFRLFTSAFFDRMNATGEANYAVLYHYVCLSRILAALHQSEEVEKKHFVLGYHVASHHPIKWVGGNISSFTVNLG